jgi:hypothetical protein
MIRKKPGSDEGMIIFELSGFFPTEEEAGSDNCRFEPCKENPWLSQVVRPATEGYVIENVSNYVLHKGCVCLVGLTRKGEPL